LGAPGALHDFFFTGFPAEMRQKQTVFCGHELYDPSSIILGAQASSLPVPAGWKPALPGQQSHGAGDLPVSWPPHHFSILENELAPHQRMYRKTAHFAASIGRPAAFAENLFVA